ncbi:hypothetical protein VNO80_30384 [Phaseolus coccineus]|uniref:Uncharacterized protein n=1 Tax=Phaseolus coccineus TaxID=3886 RepID=A0AAN9LHR5_PHACN
MVEEVVEFLCSGSWGPDIAMEDMDADVEGQQLSGLQNTRHLNEAIDKLGGQFGCFSEVIDELEEEPKQFNVAFKELSRPLASPLTLVGDGGTTKSVSSLRCGSRINARMEVSDTALSSACYPMLATRVIDEGLVVAETPSGCGSDSTYSLVVRRSLGVAVAVHSGGLSASPVVHVCLHHRATSSTGAGKRMSKVGECSSSKSQEVGYACLDGINELSHKTM